MCRIISFFIVIVFFFSCKKETFVTSGDARLSISIDTLKFDTVFTTVGSITQSFKIRNDNNQKLRLNNIKLMGGASSSFQLNIDGQPTAIASDLELAANDSLYIFVKIIINQNTANLPFLVKDSIKIEFNGNTNWVQLQAYGQNARFLKNQKITSNTTWNNQLPYVILGGLTVDTFATLTIDKGTKIYCSANAPIIIHGTLKINGEKDTDDRVYFRGDRLDNDYKDLPGGWPGITFSNASKNNVMNFAVLKNAHQAIVTIGGATNIIPKLTLNECIIDNAYDIGLSAFSSSVNSRNCLFSNCGNNATLGEGGSNIILRGGGNYAFNYATIATFGNIYTTHKQPVLYISNSGGASPAALSAIFKNSIIYGEGGLADDEIKTDKQGTTLFDVTLDNVLYKVKNADPPNIRLLNNTTALKNQNPMFNTINILRNIYDFHLKPTSPCINKGTPIVGINFDLDGKIRTFGSSPDVGCYELQ